MTNVFENSLKRLNWRIKLTRHEVIGEHHREDFAVSAPEIVLAAGAVNTKKIRLSSAVTILSSIDPVRVYQQYATIDALSNGRAEIMAGRGSLLRVFHFLAMVFQTMMNFSMKN